MAHSLRMREKTNPYTKNTNTEHNRSQHAISLLSIVDGDRQQRSRFSLKGNLLLIS